MFAREAAHTTTLTASGSAVFVGKRAAENHRHRYKPAADTFCVSFTQFLRFFLRRFSSFCLFLLFASVLFLFSSSRSRSDPFRVYNTNRTTMHHANSRTE